MHQDSDLVMAGVVHLRARMRAPGANCMLLVHKP
jgi:hypothetical protein